MAGSNMNRFKQLGKILLWVLLGVILSPLILLLLIIFLIMSIGRIKYNIDARIGQEKSAYVEISYFMRLIHVVINYADGKLEQRIRVAWMRLGEEKPRKKRKGRRRKKSTKAKNPTKPDVNPPSTKTETHDGTTAKGTKPDPNYNAASASAPDATTTQHDKSLDSKTTPKNDKAPPKEPKKDRLAPLKQVKAVLTYPDRKTIIALCFQCIKKFIRALKPKHLRINGIIGLDDPANTAWLMGAYEALMGILRLRQNIQILGSYHEKALHLEIETHGRTRLGSLIWPFIWLYLKKPIRTLIHKHILRKGE